MWLKRLKKEARKTIGTDIKTVQYGWPLGMPLVRQLEPRLRAVRSRISEGIARLVFTVVEDKMVLLHGLVQSPRRCPSRNWRPPADG